MRKDFLSKGEYEELRKRHRTEKDGRLIISPFSQQLDFNQSHKILYVIHNSA
ncbi:MAG: hypothetical protein LBP41_01215 [Holosporaceae bacterium]|nr:hypothetical protein [Holosporaceae bacterium]